MSIDQSLDVTRTACRVCGEASHGNLLGVGTGSARLCFTCIEEARDTYEGHRSTELHGMMCDLNDRLTVLETAFKTPGSEPMDFPGIFNWLKLFADDACGVSIKYARREFEPQLDDIRARHAERVAFWRTRQAAILVSVEALIRQLASDFGETKYLRLIPTFPSDAEGPGK